MNRDVALVGYPDPVPERTMVLSPSLLSRTPDHVPPIGVKIPE